MSFVKFCLCVSNIRCSVWCSQFFFSFIFLFVIFLSGLVTVNSYEKKPNRINKMEHNLKLKVIILWNDICVCKKWHPTNFEQNSNYNFIDCIIFYVIEVRAQGYKSEYFNVSLVHNEDFNITYQHSHTIAPALRCFIYSNDLLDTFVCLLVCAVIDKSNLLFENIIDSHLFLMCWLRTSAPQLT